jgi:hypothetical protein
MHKKKCIELQEPVRAALTTAAGRPINLDVRIAAPRAAATVSTRKPPSTPRHVAADNGIDDHADLANDDGSDDGNVGGGIETTESVVDQIAKSFPGARIVDTKK